MTPDSAVLDTLAAGTTLGPSHHRFSLISASGSTPAGPLWLAEDQSVQGTPTVSLSFIDPQLYNDHALMEAIKRQVALGKKLKHKHILKIYGLFSHQNALRFISSEPIDDATLSRFIATGKAGKLKKEQLQGLLLQIASALDTAYSVHQTVHGALCPNFIHITRNGVKLTGFGLNDFMERLPDTLHDERSYLPYRAPETHLSVSRSRSSDIYALACIGYELVSGKPPFTTTLNTAQCNPDTLKRPSALSKEGWTQLQSALSADPALRPGSATALVRSLFSEETQSPKEGEATAPAPPASSRIEVPADTAPNRPPAPPRQLPASLLRYAGIFIAGVGVGYLLSYLLPAPHPPAAPVAGGAKVAETTELSAPVSIPAIQPAPSAQNTSPGTSHSTGSTDAPGAAIFKNDNVVPAIDTLADSSGTDAPRTLMFRDPIIDSVYGPDMVVIPAGSFAMGARSKQADDNEYPQHTVTFSRAFALGRYEVTFEQYDLFARESGRPLPADEGWGRGNRPVINVSWEDANAYARWLATVTGQPYRLPSEAEWEYAARANSNSVFSWGDQPADGHAVCDGCGSEWDGRQSAPVGSLRANSWGLFDMAGNVGEWVADCYQPDYNQAPQDGQPALNPPCSSRVVRGGSWFDIPRLIRPAGRYRHPADATQNDWGFRVALDLPPDTQESAQ